MKNKSFTKKLTAAAVSLCSALSCAAYAGTAFTSAADEQSYVNLYKNLIKGITADNTVTSISFYLIDLDGDNSPEMITKYGSCEADMRTVVYTVKNDKVLNGGQFGAGHTSYYVDNKTGQLVSVWSHMGATNVVWWDFKNNDLTVDENTPSYFFNSDYTDNYDEQLAEAGDITPLDSVHAYFWEGQWTSYKYIGFMDAATSSVPYLDLSYIDDYAEAHSGEALPDYVKEYKSLIENYVSSDDSLAVFEYVVFDMDFNGTPELLMKHGTCEDDAVTTVYTFMDGKVCNGGEIEGGYNQYMVDPVTGELVIITANKGGASVFWYKFNDHYEAEMDMDCLAIFTYESEADYEEKLAKCGPLQPLDHVAMTNDGGVWWSYKYAGGKSTAPIEVGINTSLVDDYAKKYAARALGDLNGDVKTDATDASDILVAYGKLSTIGMSGLSPAQEAAADVNKDKLIDASDASAVLAYYGYLSTTADENVLSLEAFMDKK